MIADLERLQMQTKTRKERLFISVPGTLLFPKKLLSLKGYLWKLLRPLDV